MNRVILFLFIILISGCKNEPRPSGREQQKLKNSRTEYLREMNKVLVEQQLKMIEAICDSSDYNFIEDSVGYYYVAFVSGSNPKAEKNDVVHGIAVIKTLNDELLDSTKLTYRVGRDQSVPVGIHSVTKKMGKGDSALLYLPYHMAYGVKGIPGKITPYQPVKIKLAITDLKKR